MKELIEVMQPEEWLKLNAKLQQKKNALRKTLKDKGILKKGATNTYDKYSYFSEAQYKELFTELFSSHGLELKFDEIAYDTFSGPEKQANGRMPKLEFVLFDTETGFYESTTITGEGIDKGDKAGYKAYTGALKYFLADTFMVATGDDPEKDSPENTMNNKEVKKASSKQIELLQKYFNDEQIAKMLEINQIQRLEDLPMVKASEYISKMTKGGK